MRVTPEKLTQWLIRVALDNTELNKNLKVTNQVTR